MASPLSQFEIKTLIPIEVFGYDISFTNSSLAMLITIISILLFMIIGLKNSNIVPSRKQSLIETRKIYPYHEPKRVIINELYHEQRNDELIYLGVEALVGYGFKR